MDTNRIQIHQLQDFLLSAKVQEALTCFVILSLFISPSPALGTTSQLIPWAGEGPGCKAEIQMGTPQCSGTAGSSPRSGPILAVSSSPARLRRLKFPYSGSSWPDSFAAASLNSWEDFGTKERELCNKDKRWGSAHRAPPRLCWDAAASGVEPRVCRTAGEQRSFCRFKTAEAIPQQAVGRLAGLNWEVTLRTLSVFLFLGD